MNALSKLSSIWRTYVEGEFDVMEVVVSALGVGRLVEKLLERRGVRQSGQRRSLS